MTKTHIVDSSSFSYHPLPIKLYNWLGKQWQSMNGNSPITAAQLMQAAIKKTGLDDFGNDPFKEPLEILLQSINEEASLHAFGKFITKQRLTGLLANRLRAEHFFKAASEISDLQLATPVIITGLQRTGTTFLQRLLANDPANRSLLSWEALNPAPFLNNNNDKEDRRIAEARTAEKGLKYISPGFFAIHPVEHNAPEEDILLLDNSFLSTVPEATMHVPTFAVWLEEQDTVAAYAYMRKLLKLLQWQRNGQRWILKSPHHLEFLQDLFTVFPDAKIIHTHRDPYKTLPSFCNMIAYSRSIFSDAVDPIEVAKHWTRKTSRMVNKAMEYRNQHGDNRFLDIHYKDLTADPIKTVKEIYQFLDTPMSSTFLDNLEASLKVNHRHKYGVHKYRMQDFGLKKSIIDEHFGAYRERFGIGEEG